jgi:hypothetical protein
MHTLTEVCSLFMFARGLVAEYKGFKVNCVEHSTSAKTQR